MAVQIDPASILIEAYLSLKTLLSGSIPFDAAVLKDNPPRYYRLLRFKSALAALELNCTDFLAFENGDLIVEDRQLFDKVEELLVKEFELPIANYVDANNKEYFSCADHFQALLATRLITYQFRSQRESILAASGHFLTPIKIAESIETKIQNEMAVLDQALRLFLNPEGKRFLMSELIDQFGFPAVDLDEIDLDWF
jgi:hypothetical protein